MPAPSSTPTPEANVWCERPYSPTSIWNLPINWNIAQVHPQSDRMRDAFFKTHSWIGADPTQYAAPLYLVTKDTPYVPVRLRQFRFRDAIDDRTIRYGAPGGTILMPLPPNAHPAPGTDAQLVVVNVDTGEEWGLIYGAVDALNRWTVGSAYRYHIRNSGIPPEDFMQRGAGIGQLAGLIRPCEVARGHIDHAVTLAYNFPCAPETCAANGWPAVIPPFTRTDGKGTYRYDIPEGARMAMRPDISLEAIVQACHGVRGCIVWARAMQEYGGFIVDNSGHPKTYPEGQATAHWDAAIWSSEMLSDIPKEWFVILDWNHPSTSIPWDKSQ